MKTIVCDLSMLNTVLCEVSELNAKAAKLGVPGLTATHVATGWTVGGWDVERLWHATVEVTGEAPKVPGGWRFLARIEHHEDGNYVSKLPWAEGDLSEGYRTAAADCAHCGYKRSRKVTYVVRSECGDEQQVGSTCLLDFTGDPGVEAHLSLWERLERLSDEWGQGGGSRHDETSLLAFLGVVCAYARIDGFFSAKTEHPTAVCAWNHMFFPPRPGEDNYHAKREKWEAHRPTEADRERAATIIAWAESKPATSDYWWNAKLLLEGLAVDQRKAGLAASLVLSYQKDMGEQLARAARPEGRHFGEVGKRVEVKGAECVRVHSYDTPYGTKTIVALVLPTGEELTWFTSGVPEVEVGKRYTGKVTIKKHEAYKGRPQTVVQRASLVAV